MQDFASFVAIKIKDAPVNSYGYKAMKSFTDVTQREIFYTLEDALKYWLASMIDNGISATIRNRYIGKLNTIYEDCLPESKADINPFHDIVQLNFEYSNGKYEDMAVLDKGIDRIFNHLLYEAKSRPALAVFLYMLFNASSDIKKAIMLQTEEYESKFVQLEDVIVPASFHHRRKYVFGLNQSHKREPQLVKEVLTEISSYMTDRGIKLKSGFSNSLITAIWIGKAKACGVSLSEIVSVLDTIPSEYSYLQLIQKTELSVERKDAIKERVANAFAPACKRWYAIKLRRGVSFDTLQTDAKEAFPDFYSANTFFYPQKEVSRRVDKKIVTEAIPVIPDIVFLYVQPRHAGQIDHRIKMECLGWVFKSVNTPESNYSVIDRPSMLNFQRMIGIFTPDMKIELTKEAPVGIGRRVRITGGILVGYEGVIYDIKNGDGSDARQIYIKLSQEYSVKAELKIEEHFVEPIESPVL